MLRARLFCLEGIPLAALHDLKREASPVAVQAQKRLDVLRPWVLRMNLLAWAVTVKPTERSVAVRLDRPRCQSPDSARRFVLFEELDAFDSAAQELLGLFVRQKCVQSQRHTRLDIFRT